MSALIFVVFGLSCYVGFLVVILHTIGFVAGLPLPRTVDIGPSSPWRQAIPVDLALLGVFGIQHSVMARASFKRLWTRIVPPAIERSTYVLASTLALGLVIWQWRPIPQPVVWAFTGAEATVLQAVFWLGWGVMLASSFMIDHFELFGLRQVRDAMLKRAAGEPAFRTPLFYRYVRHPLYLGVLLGLWATPRMTAGHLLFAAGFTGYVLVGIYFEERDLVAQFGRRYGEYRRRVGMLLPWRNGTI